MSFIPPPELPYGLAIESLRADQARRQAIPQAIGGALERMSAVVLKKAEYQMKLKHIMAEREAQRNAAIDRLLGSHVIRLGGEGRLANLPGTTAGVNALEHLPTASGPEGIVGDLNTVYGFFGRTPPINLGILPKKAKTADETHLVTVTDQMVKERGLPAELVGKRVRPESLIGQVKTTRAEGTKAEKDIGAELRAIEDDARAEADKAAQLAQNDPNMLGKDINATRRQAYENKVLDLLDTRLPNLSAARRAKILKSLRVGEKAGPAPGRKPIADMLNKYLFK